MSVFTGLMYKMQWLPFLLIRSLEPGDFLHLFHQQSWRRWGRLGFLWFNPWLWLNNCYMWTWIMKYVIYILWLCHLRTFDIYKLNIAYLLGRIRHEINGAGLDAMNKWIPKHEIYSDGTWRELAHLQFVSDKHFIGGNIPHQGPILLTRINVNPSMDKYLYPS